MLKQVFHEYFIHCLTQHKCTYVFCVDFYNMLIKSHQILARGRLSVTIHAEEMNGKPSKLMQHCHELSSKGFTVLRMIPVSNVVHFPVEFFPNYTNLTDACSNFTLDFA